MYKILITTLVSLLVLAVSLLAYSVWPEPSPEKIKANNDLQRVEELNTIIEVAHEFRRRHNQVPNSLEELTEIRSRLRWHDPVTGDPYEYTRISADIYSLCAVFETSAADNAFGYLPGFSRHGLGHTCVYRTFE